MNLQQLHSVYGSLLHIEDTDRIDVILSVVLSNKMDGIPLWMIIVGASGDMKSVQLNSLVGDDIFILHNLTSKTLVNGYKDKKEHPDLAPKLNNKVVIIPDMAQILKLPPSEKGQIWGQLRDLYDGYAGKSSGMGTDTKYSDLKITLLAGSTPAIDGQILVHQDLGTRELIYRTRGNQNKGLLMDKCFQNENVEDEIKKRLREVTTEFLKGREINREAVDKEKLEKIKKIAIYITYMRATAEFDNYTHELRNWVYPEEPSRIAKQLKRLYVCLKSLDENYDEFDAFEILWHVARSSAFPIRVRLFDYLLKETDERSTSGFSELLKIGKATAKRELSVLHNMGLVSCRKEETTYPDRFYEYWKINESHPFIKNYLNIIKPSIDIL